ncbi:MAG: T9SS type A sorting domain-containing protein [Flavobacteriales bacterium]|nr:T9SS type A sorting domain-containing protein [Flavobacteriales bacterium]
MKFRITLVLMMLWSACTELIAQSNGSCPSDDLNNTLLENDPVFHRSFMYMEQRLMLQQGLDPAQRTNDIYTLPVVVHVIHNGEAYGVGTNITDEQIVSAIDAMNDDFRHVAGTNGYGAGADVGIEFCLASRNPSGQPTTGIVRVNGSSVANYSTMGIEASAGNGAVEETVKALSTWPRDSYVNIWVVNEIENNDGGAGIQGYAYFPINNPIDGIVILYNAFGTTGNLKSYTNMNRTITHEMGHYLGLYHTFNATSSCAAEADCNTAGDRVCDTPVTIQAASCSSPACSGTQQVENYMDYTPQTCQDMFTEGQKLRMRTTLETQRPTMINSLGCMPVFTLDAGVTAILSPVGSNCQGSMQPVVTLTNFGSTTLTSVAIQYNLDGVGSNTYNWTGSLASGTSTTVTLGALNPAIGTHTVYAWTNNPNGTTDQNSSNNQATGDFEITDGAAATLDIVTDYFGHETTWDIKDAMGNVLISGGPYADGQQGTHNYESICLAEGCYTLTMYDQYGDGQGFTAGSFTLTASDGSVLAYGSGDWNEQSINPFCLESTVPTGNPPVASFTIQDNTLCKNVQNDYTSTSTNSPTTYAWTFEGGTPATSSQANPQNVTYANAGTFDVTLTATNAYGSHTYTCTDCITVYADPTLTLTGTNPTCSTGNTGSVSSTVTGSSPYTYAWSTGATTANISNVGAGSYTLTVTDSHGCTKQSSTTLTAPAAITVTGTTTNPTCAGTNNGSITVSASGGTGSKTFTWSNGASGATVNNLAAGSYTVTATDANGCTKTQSFTLTAPSAITITGTATNMTCAGNNNGSVTVSASGGTGSKTFSWSNGASGATVSNLGAGSYTVTATDANGCTATQAYTITAPTALSVTGTATNMTCAGVNNGSITASATGGTGSKTYSWSNGATGASVSNLGAGSYTVTAIDANGCTATQSFTITAPTAMAITGTTTNVLCAGTNSGSITASATGGTGNKTFSWSNGQTGATANGLGAGSYTVTATDANGCTATQSFTITAPAALALSSTVSQVNCAGGADGSITIAATGGTGNKTYSWNNGMTGATINGLSAGNYTVTVTDQNNCSATLSVGVTQPSALQLNLADFDIACTATSGGATVNPAGGTSPYTVNWSNNATGNNAGLLNAGDYSVSVTDAHGCAASANFSITQSENLSVYIQDVQISCFGENDGSATAVVSGGGNLTYAWSNGGNTSTINGLVEGEYSVTVTNESGCSGSADVLIIEPSALVVQMETANISCYGAGDGIASVIVSGGVGSYTYLWSNNATASSVSDLNAGNYGVVVTDGSGCMSSAEANITEPLMLAANVIILSPESCAGNDGSAEVSVEGGSPGYFVTWSNGSNAMTLTDAASGTYALSVTDVNGCVLNMDVEIPYECATPVPQTQLAGDDCNAINLAINSVISCEEVVNASMYQWRFSNEAGAIISDEYSLGNSFYVSQIPNVTLGETYMIGVKALVDGTWGPFGNICSITLEMPIELTTRLIDEDCGSTVNSWQDTLTAIEIPGAMNYQWHITGIDYDWTTYTEVNQLPMASEMQLQPGEVYSVQIRCAMGAGQFISWGMTCEVYIGQSIGVSDFIQGDGHLIIYPNPSNGENIFFDMSNLSPGAVVEDLGIYNSAGQLVEKINLNNRGAGHSTSEYRFNQTLAAGMYILKYKIDGHDHDEKLIVNGR